MVTILLFITLATYWQNQVHGYATSHNGILVGTYIYASHVRSLHHQSYLALLRRHRVCHTGEQSGLQLFSQLILRQPLEVRQTKLILRQIRLTSHDPTLEVEDLVATSFERPAPLGIGVVLERRLLLQVGDGVAAHHPGVHIYACSVC